MKATPFGSLFGALGVVCVLAVQGCKSSDNEKGSMDTVNAKSPRPVAMADCAALPSATDLAKLLKAAPIPGKRAGCFTARPSGRR